MGCVVAMPPPRGFTPSGMYKNGTQSGPSNTTFVDVAPMTADTGTYPGSTTSSNGVVIQNTADGVTLAASIPYTAAPVAGGAHVAQIVRVSDGLVVVTGSSVTTTSGTCTASVVRNVVAGEAYKAQIRGQVGYMWGTVTSGPTCYLRATL